MLREIRIAIIRLLIELNETIVFNRRLIKFYRDKFKVNKVSTIIDVGANLGQSIDIFLKLNPECEIFAFEPNPTLFNKLVVKYADKKNVKLFQLGVSSEAGEKTFYENVFHSTSTFEELDMNSEYLKKKSKALGVKPQEIIAKSYTVKVTTLSEFINIHCKKTIDVLKIDTEGHEYSCLQGLFNVKNIPVRNIQLEMHNDDMYLNAKSFTEINKILTDNNFEIETKIKHGFGDFDEVIFINKSM